MKVLFTSLALLICQMAIGQIPNLTIQSSENNRPLQLSHLMLDIEVVGNVATTTYDMVFFNPNPRDLEGELAMPLGDGKEIYRYALEINGQLREGVVVEKIKARQTFEAVVRQKIDPGIVSKTKGNFFKTKIYPIPANDSKRVVLGLVETLDGDSQNLYYAMPIGRMKSIGEFEVNVNVAKSQSESVAPVSDFENLSFDSRKEMHNLNFKRANYSLSKPLEFTVPRFINTNYQLFTEAYEGTTYFYLNLKAPTMGKAFKKPPNHITIYWDRSHSASQRDISKELDLLSKYLASLQGTKKVTFIGFNYQESAPMVFKIDDDPTDLVEYILKLKNDGATRIDNIKFDNKCDEILLFSDAIHTIGKADFEPADVPVYCINSSYGANHNLLNRTSSFSKGAFIDLNQIRLERALELMKVNEEKIISIDYDTKSIDQVYPNMPGRVDNFVEVVGVLKTNQSNLTINYGHQGKVTQSQTFEIRKSSSAAVSRIWANKKIASLAWDYPNNQQKILDLGKKFNIVTSNSSLLVLDRVEDYVAHEIIPPVELKETYDQLIAQKKKEAGVSMELIRANNANRINRLKQWYDRPFTMRKDSKRRENAGDTDLRVEVTEETILEEVVYEEAPDDQVDEIFEIVEDQAVSHILQGRVSGVQVSMEAEAKESDQDPAGPSIKVLAWQPDAPYLVDLRKASDKGIDQVYYHLKKTHENRPSFYIEVADLFFQRNLNERAIQILSNTIEMDLENPELLKVVAKRLLDEKEHALAVIIYEEIKDLRPEEPQSHRDLALAYIANQQYQKALEVYQNILDQQWGRFEEIKDVILIELSGLIATHENELALNKVSADSLMPMPLDVRITIDWSSNDNDIDLWVIDPNGEKCLYSNPNTQLGGKLSKDFTQGYGPEEYSLKSAIRGTYTVYVNYYSESRQTITGPVTVYATLFTHYGTQQQKSKRIAIQLANNKETKQIGQLEFEN